MQRHEGSFQREYSGNHKIAEDRRNDLALLKTTESPKHSLALSMESPFPLQEIIVAGYPFGEKVSSTLKFTQGIVSSIAGLGMTILRYRLMRQYNLAILVVPFWMNTEMWLQSQSQN